MELSPDNFSGHEELARLAEQRDDLPLAAEHYERAWQLRPDQRALLLDLGRVWKEQGRDEDAMSALLAASRGAEPTSPRKRANCCPSAIPMFTNFRKRWRSTLPTSRCGASSPICICK